MFARSKRLVFMLSLLMLLFGCKPHREEIIFVADCSIKTLDEKTLDAVLLTARNNAWKRFRVVEFASRDNGERVLSISPIRQSTEGFDNSLTIVIRDGVVVQEHWGR